MTKVPLVPNQVPLPVFFQLMADRIPGVVWAIDTELRFTASFGAGLAALGLRPSEIIGSTIFEYFQTEDEAAPPVAAHLAALQGELVKGEQVWQDRRFRFQLEQLRDEAGAVIGCIGFAQDISEQTRAETSLRESNRRLATLLKNLPGAVYRCRADANWTVEFLSEGYLALTDYAPAELVGGPGTRHSQLIHPEDRQRELKVMQEAIAERRQYQVEYRLRTASGEEKWVWEQGMGIFSENGELEALEGFTTDITPRKRMEKELRASEVKYRRLYQSLRDAFIRVDMTGRILEFNDAYCQMLGYEPAELLALTYTDITPQKWHSLEAEIVEKQILQRRYSDTYEKEYRRRDGTVFPVELRTFLVTDDDDQPSTMWAIVRDITERKAAEAALVRSRDELERRVEERTAELVEANRLLKAEIRERQQAEEKLRQERNALSRMLQASDRDRELITFEIHDGVAQRLLGALMQFEACEHGARFESNAVKAMFDAGLQGLREASAEARSLMNRTRTPVLEKFGVKAAIADYIDQLSERPNSPEIMYRCDVKFHRLAPDIENAIFRVAQEALTNACRHSTSEMVRVSLVQDGEEVTLEVEDHGIGFDVAAVAKGRFGVDGMRERTKAFGKSFHLESIPGQGTRIRATFPVRILAETSHR